MIYVLHFTILKFINHLLQLNIDYLDIKNEKNQISCLIAKFDKSIRNSKARFFFIFQGDICTMSEFQYSFDKLFYTKMRIVKRIKGHFECII